MVMSFDLPTVARATTLSVDDLGGASSFSAPIGSQFQVGIYADTFSDLFAWQSDISWSPTVLRLDKVTEGGALLPELCTRTVDGMKPEAQLTIW